MDKLLVVFKREYLERVRSKWFLVATFLGPIFFGVLTILPGVLAARTKGSTDLTNIAVIDATNSELGARVAKSISRLAPGGPAPQLRITAVPAIASAESLATREVVAKKLKGYLVLDASTIAGQRVRYAGRNASTLRDVESLGRTVRSSLLNMRFENEGISPERVMTLTAMNLET